MLPRGLLKEYAGPLSLLLRGLDMFAIIIAGLAAYWYRFGDLQLSPLYWGALAVAALLTWAVFSFFRIYESVRTQGLWKHLQTLIQAILIVLFSLAVMAFLTKLGTQFSRSWFLHWAIFSTTLLLFVRGSLLLFLRLMRAHHWNERCVVIIGAGELGVKLAETLQQAVWVGCRIVAILDDDIENKPSHIRGIPVSSMPDDLSHYLQTAEHTIDEIWLALPLSAEGQVKKILHTLRHHTISIRLVLDVFGFDLFNHGISDLAGFPALNLNTSPMIGMNRIIKAIEDRILALLILVLISPLLLFVAMGVKLSSAGPVFFKQLRHGWDGRLITIYKFRTMYVHNESEGQITQAKANDRRITPFGRFLRKTSLDELPQFINVLQGRMSIVGPRPHAVSHNEYYKNSIEAYMQRHKVKPGITGWAQINGWRGETERIEKMEKRIEYDLYYIEHWSLGFDLKIIFLTLFQGFIHKNAY